MNKKLKVLTVVGTRPEIIKLSRVINELDKQTDHILVHTGQNYDYELNEIFFNDLEIRKPDHFLETAGGTPASTIAKVIERTDVILRQENPDAFLIYGDTNSCLSVIAAKRLKIPIFHMEAGNRCFDQRVPEEINRKIVDHLSDINMPLSEHARSYLILEGIKAETVIKTGSPIKEIVEYHSEKINSSNILEREGLSEDDYFLVSIHREENVDEETNFNELLKSLKEISNTYKKKVIVSTHPRTEKRLKKINFEKEGCDIEFMKPFGFFDYQKLQKMAYCVLSDSGTITEESSILNLPAITIRQSHERPEGMDEGTLIMSGLKAERICQSIDIVRSHYNRNLNNFSIVSDYDVNNVSKKVVRIILSYTDYINRNIWKKYEA